MQDKRDLLPWEELSEPAHRYRYTLPVPLTPLLGREREEASVCSLLRNQEVRLLTLTGPGGIGKTRLALQVAAHLLDDFADGACFVSLAPISDPELVLPTIARALELKEVDERPLPDLLQAFLRHKQLLLLLDNFEQIVTVAPLLVNLLANCPEVKFLVTSRTTLRVWGEYECPVPPLALPNLKHLPASNALSGYAAVNLFVHRVRAIKPDFQLTSANARTLAEICVRLDGLPLAIELAAARIKLLPPTALLARLDQRLAVLTSGARDLPARQQTLRNTIAWSYQLLDADEQQLFRQLCVFANGCTLEAIESVCSSLGNGELSVLDGAASLIDKNLLRQTAQDGEEPRLAMLETIREFGQERLSVSGEDEATRLAHAHYYLQIAERAEPEFSGPEQTAWLDRLEQEQDNMRAALHWLLEPERANMQSKEMALRLAGALRQFWMVRGHLREGQTLLERALLASEGSATSARAKALKAAAFVTIIRGELDRGEALAREGLTLYRILEDKRGIALCLHQLERVARTKGHREAAHAMAEEALLLLRQVDDKPGIAWSIYRLAAQEEEHDRANALYAESLAIHRELENKEGIVGVCLRWAERLLNNRGDQVQAYALLEESLMLARELRHKESTANALYILGHMHLRRGEVVVARPLLEEGLALFKELDDPNGVALSLSALSRAAVMLGESTAALALCKEEVTRARAAGDTALIVACVEALASVVAEQGQPLWAAQLWGAAEAQRKAADLSLMPGELIDYESEIAAARSQAGRAAFAAAWLEGQTMMIEQVLSAPLSTGQAVAVPKTVKKIPPPPTYPDGLTVREVEVLRLVAQGKTDAQVARELVVSRRTVNWHLTSIYSKIGVSSRAAATRYAIEQKLA